MKKVIAALCGVFALSFAYSQSALPPLDKSPLDMSYYPVDFPVLSIQNKITGDPVARVVYSRPQKNNRKIFGDLVPYGSVWRLGANEATELQFFKDVKLGNKKIPKGRYTLYALPSADKWTMILNKSTDTWGAYKYDSTKDLARLDVPVKQTDSTEIFTIVFEKDTDKSANIVVSWEMDQVKLPFSWQ
jgi:Protein of unknown function (DUF2911)